MANEFDGVTVTKTEFVEIDEKKDVRAAAKRAADLVSHFKEDSDDISESEVEIIHINTVVNGEEGSDTSPPKRRRGAQLDDTGNSAKKRRYLQKYVKDWEKIPSFKPWLSESLIGATYFYCKFCKSDNKCGKAELEKHMLSRKHIRNSKGAIVRVQVSFLCLFLGNFLQCCICRDNLHFVVYCVRFLHRFKKMGKYMFLQQ